MSKPLPPALVSTSCYVPQTFRHRRAPSLRIAGTFHTITRQLSPFGWVCTLSILTGTILGFVL